MTTTIRPTPPGAVASRRSPALLVGLGVLIVAAIAAIVTALLLAFGGPAAAPKSVVPWPQPAAVSQVQHELGQLNYYEGPDDGQLNPQTTEAISYLQRDANLPQTGQFDAATQAALANFIAHGNNQMAG
jgi:hypothetical protein